MLNNWPINLLKISQSTLSSEYKPTLEHHQLNGVHARDKGPQEKLCVSQGLEQKKPAQKLFPLHPVSLSQEPCDTVSISVIFFTPLASPVTSNPQLCLVKPDSPTWREDGFFCTKQGIWDFASGPILTCHTWPRLSQSPVEFLYLLVASPTKPSPRAAFPLLNSYRKCLHMASHYLLIDFSCFSI